MLAEPQTDNTTTKFQDAETPHAGSASAVGAADRALAAAAAPKSGPSPHQARHYAEMERLSLHRMTVHSEALRAAIDTAMTLKQAAFELEQACAAAKAACDGEVEAESAWLESRRQLDAAALTVAHAPFSDLSDVAARAEAFAEIVGRPDKDAPPELDEDHILMLGSYRQAIMEMLERQPSRGDWDDAVARLREIDRRIEVLDASQADKGRMIEACADRDAAITDLLSMQPPHLDGLLVLMEIICQGDGPDVQSYASRANAAGAGRLTATDLLHTGPHGLFRGLALIAQHAARLRDLEMPRDWRDAMRDFGRIAPGAADTVRNAFDHCMHLPQLKAIQLSGQPDHELPIMLFSGPDGDHWIGPKKAWRGEGVK